MCTCVCLSFSFDISMHQSALGMQCTGPDQAAAVYVF
jgi:hypothetical protein